MIKASELRIGNYIFIDGTPAVIKTLNIPDNELLWINYVQGFKNPLQTVDEDGPWPPDRYNPIPLTPEWLERCGFDKRKQDEDYEYWGIKNFTLLYGRTTDSSNGWFLNGYHNDCHIQYLHHLQNLYFALTGEELTINHEHLQIPS